METVITRKKMIAASPAKNIVVTDTSWQNTATSPMVHGIHQSIIKLLMWLNVLLLAFIYFRNPVKAFKALKELKKKRHEFRGRQPVIKYAKTNNKYYFTFNAPGWPSSSFNKYVFSNIKRLDVSSTAVTLDTVIFGITKKCGYKCEHCFEWEALNKPETLTRQDLLHVIGAFQKAGITQVQLSGGEPLNRFDDIIYILQHIKKDTEVWLYTSGYHLTKQRSALLKQNGLAGVTISLDHWIPELHDAFRGKQGSFEWAQQAALNAKNAGLVVSLSLCAIRDFVSHHNLVQYADVAKQWGISFVQVLEPRAVGHYAGKDVHLSEAQIQLLEDFFTSYNYDRRYSTYPSVVYHGFYSRRVTCGGGGKHYVYVDTDGDVHNCPFCQRKMFSALHDNIEHNLQLMAASSCSVFAGSPPKNTTK